MQLKVHGTILSPWVRRLVLFIEEKGLDYELKTVVPMGEPDPDFLKISPLGKIPVLEFNGRFLPDSLAACTLLEAEVADPPLFPERSNRRISVNFSSLLFLKLYPQYFAFAFGVDKTDIQRFYRFTSPDFQRQFT